MEGMGFVDATMNRTQEALHSATASVKSAGTKAKGKILSVTSNTIKRRKTKRTAVESKVSRIRHRLLTRADEASYFEPHSWSFWRGIIMYLFVFSMVGHWMELPWCSFMSLFGIVEADYAAVSDPWYVPYWVYGIGAAALTLIMLPLKVNIVKRRKTLIGAFLEFFVLAVVLCAFLETTIGLLINQPDATGEYPFWNNSQLPFNILEQGWLVNDLALGLVSILYVWVLFPLCQKFCKFIGMRRANKLFFGMCILCAVVCFVTYAVPPLMSLFA